MLQISLWTRILVALVVVGCILIALPNALPERARPRLPSFMSNTVSLGLDLQGGSYLLLEVDFVQVQKDKAESIIGDIRGAFRKAHIPYTDIVAKGDTASVRVLDAGRIDEARTLLQGLNPTLGTAVLSVGARQYYISEPCGGVFLLRRTDAD